MQRILVIDNDECIRDTIGVMLERESYLLLYAADGKSGYQKTIWPTTPIAWRSPANCSSTTHRALMRPSPQTCLLAPYATARPPASVAAISGDIGQVLNSTEHQSKPSSVNWSQEGPEFSPTHQ